MPDDQKNEVIKRMAVLREKYLEQLTDRRKTLEEFLAKSKSGSLTETDRIEIINQSHKMAGTGATYGFPAISATARRLEEALLTNPLVSHKTLETMISEILEACDAAPTINDLLQAHTDAPQPPTQAQESALIADTRPIVLAIDDDPDILGILETVLTSHARLILAKSTNEAYKILRDTKPDIILLDDIMPGSVSGLQFLVEKKRDKDIAHIPVIMITATNKIEDVKRALVAGAVDYIAKPFVPGQLTEKVLLRIRQHKMSVLIADDDDDVRNLLTAHFAGNGFMVYEAVDGSKCLSIAEKERPDLIVLDRMMPQLDGIGVLKRMRQDPKLHKTPVLMLTAKGQLADVKEGLSLGASDYVIKPFTPEEVVSRAMRRIKEVKYRA